jgi:hypothetical protein
MQKCLLALVTFVAITSFGRPAQAYYDAPWCAVIDLGPGSSVERCEYWNFAACRQEITGGNRGFCIQNPRWSGAGPYPHSPRRRNRY